MVHRAGDPDVVVGNEHEPVTDLGVASQPVDFADQRLSRLVGGVRLAREHELHGPIGVEEHRAQSIHLSEQQGGALVGGESSGEADREHPRIEQVAAEAAAHHVDELAAPFVSHVPDVAMIEIANSFPVVGVGEVPLVADHL